MQNQYLQTISHIKNEILKSRYAVAKAANKELLVLYFKIGKIISDKVKTEKWGNKTIQKLSNDLQIELNGLRGFSYSNLKNMRLFYEAWQAYFSDLSFNPGSYKKTINPNSQSVSGQFIDYFFSVSFTAHIEILSKTNINKINGLKINYL